MAETEKHRHIVLPYCQGNGVDIGCSDDPVVPWAIKFDLPSHDYKHYNSERTDDALNWRGDGRELPFKDQTLDWLHSSHLLEDFLDWKPVLREWDRVVKVGGYILIAVPDHKRFRETVIRGQGDNLGHKHESRIGEVFEYLPNYQQIFDGFVSNNPLEYSLLFVGKKLGAI